MTSIGQLRTSEPIGGFALNMKTKEQLKTEIAKMEAQLKELEEAEKNKVKWFRVGDYEYETKEHDFNKILSNIKIPEGYRLWTTEECIKLHNDPVIRKELNLEDCWFFIQQPFAFNQLKGYVARFGADSGGAYLDCYGDPSGTDSSLGVRFVRKKSKRVVKQH